MRLLSRVLLGILVAAAVVALLFLVVFPWVDRTFVSDPVLGALFLQPGPRDARSRGGATEIDR